MDWPLVAKHSSQPDLYVPELLDGRSGCQPTCRSPIRNLPVSEELPSCLESRLFVLSEALSRGAAERLGERLGGPWMRWLEQRCFRRSALGARDGSEQHDRRRADRINHDPLGSQVRPHLRFSMS